MNNNRFSSLKNFALRLFKVKHFILFIVLCVFSFISFAAKQKNILFTDKKLAQIEKKYGKKMVKKFYDWKKLVRNNQKKTVHQKLKLVNDFFNGQIRWVDDEKIWKQHDYWATPIETMLKQAGDCEDFTIAKYFTLLALGVSMSKLQITYVKALKLNQAHMVLIYVKTKRAEPLVLDNINKKILKGSKRTDLKPVYSFNGEGMWLANRKKTGKKVGSSGRIRLWTDLNIRMKKENR